MSLISPSSPCSCLSRRRLLAYGGASLAAASGLSGCTLNALGRPALRLISDDQLEAAADRAWAQLKRTTVLSGNASYNARVSQVGADMVRVSQVGGTPEFIVIEDPSPNAFVLPGAKVAVHSGLFQVVESNDELAAVLGHEVGHVVARHANERASQQGLTNLAISAATGGGQDQNLARVLGLGATVGVLLPYGRRQELESDRLGVRYAHAAGYDPRAALTLWDKMASLGDARPPEFLSTHPGPRNRQDVIREEIAGL